MEELHRIIKEMNLSFNHLSALVQAFKRLRTKSNSKRKSSLHAGRTIVSRPRRRRSASEANVHSSATVLPHLPFPEAFPEGGSAVYTQSGVNLMEPSSKTICAVCFESSTEATFPDRPPTLECNHPIDTCLECLAGSIQTQYTSNIWNQISCTSCTAILTPDDVNTFADRKTALRLVPA